MILKIERRRPFTKWTLLEFSEISYSAIESKDEICWSYELFDHDISVQNCVAFHCKQLNGGWETIALDTKAYILNDIGKTIDTIHINDSWAELIEPEEGVSIVPDEDSEFCPSTIEI